MNKNKVISEADFKIHTGWGDHIEWVACNLETNEFKVWGHVPVIPKVGQTLVGEFKKSWIKFKFMKIKQENDPPDMFYGELEPIEQVMK